MKSPIYSPARGLGLLLVVLVSAGFSGCAKNRDLELVNEQQAATIAALGNEVARLNEELDALYRSREDLLRAQGDLEEKMKSEMASGNLSVSMQERGLVVTVLDSVLFDSGKAELKEDSAATLDKVGSILSGKIANNLVYVEGHTDNVPIRYSGWRSNWELSTARATEVVHYFIEKLGIDPRRLGATGYGEFQPVEANDTEAGKQKNRRVEIVISPKQFAPEAAGTS